jgi:hypothetical protein
MRVADVLNKFQTLMDEGHAEEQVFLDTNPHNLHTIGEIGLDDDGVGVIIWKE